MLNTWARTVPNATRPRPTTTASTSNTVGTCATTTTSRPAGDSTEAGVDNTNG